MCRTSANGDPGCDNHWYLGEDFAFSERARRSGFPIIADTRIRLEHIGKHGYSWEDAAMTVNATAPTISISNEHTPGQRALPTFQRE